MVDSRTGTGVDVPLGNGVVALWMSYPDYPPRELGGDAFQDRHAVRSLAPIFLNPAKQLLPDHYEDSWTTFNPTDIERCIAKIALCEAIRVVDISIRDRDVASFIIEGQGDSSAFLGASLENNVSDTMHSVTHQQLERRNGAVVEKAWMTNVQIFSFLPTPSYKVILRPDGFRQTED